MDRAVADKLFYDALWPHAEAVLRTALFLSNHHHAEAEDVAQETLLKAYRSLDQFQRGTDARRWLMTILRNAWTDRVRARGARKEATTVDRMPYEPAAPEQATLDAEWTDPEDVLNQLGDRDVIAALHELPDEIRWTLLLVDVQAMEQADAAAVLEVPVGTIKSRLHRGRRMLRDVLKPVAEELGLLGRKNRASEAEVKP